MSMTPNMRLLIVSPARNESEYAPTTIRSMIAQSRRPDLWLIVDDGSTDGMGEICEAAAAEHDWIRVLRREDRGHRAVGPGVIDAFYAGYESVDVEGFDFICKLDLDLELPPEYFERLLKRFAGDPRLGTCSGKPWFRDHAGRAVSEAIGDEMSAGMTKLYRRSCFDEIGGFVREVMWDGIDCHRCRMLGWKASSVDEPALRFEHLRAMGSSQKGILTGRMRHGFGQWFMGTSLPFMTASALFRMTRPPRIVGGAAMWLGYVRSAFAGAPRYADREFRRFLRRYQWRSLLVGKREAIAAIDRAGESVWRSRRGRSG